jgi:hypothetical protein
VVGKRRNTTPWFSVSVKEQHGPRPQTARTATANRTNRDRKPHEPRPQTARTATDSVNLLLGSTVDPQFE